MKSRHPDSPLLKAREVRGISQRKLAPLVGLTQGCLANLEAGRRYTSPRNARRLERVLGLEPGALQCLERTPNVVAQAARALGVAPEVLERAAALARGEVSDVPAS